jgi:ectoine hydroxylase-related dioxygenase (phytanoyl-CoA dioxygenase family)
MSARFADPAQARDSGVAFPLPGIGASEAAALLARIEAVEARHGGRWPKWLAAKPHLLFPWLWDLVADPRLTDPVALLLGPDLLCWQCNLISKPPESAGYVAWHQDVTYYGLSEPRGVTVWLALTATTAENGCMEVVPFSHDVALSHHRPQDPDNILPLGEEVEAEPAPGTAVKVLLQPGELSIHHMQTVHGSGPNRTAARRSGLAIRYIAADLTQQGAGVTAALVRGRDHGTFPLERRPDAEDSAEARAHHDAVMRRWVRHITRPVP